ncbi:MAG: hypothetical protein HOQ44_14615, partial [Nocardia sp.]|nr:hypothetical protein [Nocardia sp.]
MTEKGNLDARVAALEGEIGELKQRVRRTERDAAAARVLAGGADRDVSEIRAEIREFREQNLRLHNATREDITGIRGDISGIHGDISGIQGDITGIRSTVGELNGRMDHMESRIDTLTLEMRGKFDMLAAGQQQIVSLITQ